MTKAESLDRPCSKLLNDLYGIQYREIRLKPKSKTGLSPNKRIQNAES